MNTSNNTLNRRLALGLIASFCLLPWSAQAYASEEHKDWILWLYQLPDAILVCLVGLIFSVFALSVLALYRRVQRDNGHKPITTVSAVLGGAIAGILVALLAADSWKSYKYERIIQLMPTAAVPVLPKGNFLVELLETPSPEFAAQVPSRPKSAIPELPNRARHTNVNFSAMDADMLNLSLFEDSVYVAVRDRVVKGIQDGGVWIGHIEGEPGSEVILSVKGKAMMGTVRIGERLFEISYVGNNTHAVREIDNSKIPSDDPVGSEQDNTVDFDTAVTSSSTTTSTASTPSTGEVIDLLVLYTPNVQTNAGGDSGAQSKIINAVAAANQAYINSQVNINLNLVYVGLVDYVEPNALLTSLSRLQGKTDGFMDSVHGLRDQYGADLVALVDTDSDACGVGNIMKTVSTSFASSSFVVVRDSCLSAHSLSHELGHNMGNVHNTENTSTAGASVDAYGYRVCGTFRDVMSYSCAGEVRIPYFSNPNVFYNSQPTGILDYTNTARSMNATAPTVASFRSSTTIATVPNAPSNLVATVASSSAINLAWVDNASNETGYYVDRSPDGITWSLIATLGSNTLNFSDSGLGADTTYDYRVYAYNSIGNSLFSNTIVAKTNAVVVQVADTTPPTVNISNPLQGMKIGLSSQKISANASDNIGVISLNIFIDGKLVIAGTTSSLSYNWNTKRVTAGSHTISSQAVDAAGNIGSMSISVIK